MIKFKNTRFTIWAMRDIGVRTIPMPGSFDPPIVDLEEAKKMMNSFAESNNDKFVVRNKDGKIVAKSY